MIFDDFCYICDVPNECFFTQNVQMDILERIVENAVADIVLAINPVIMSVEIVLMVATTGILEHAAMAVRVVILYYKV